MENLAVAPVTAFFSKAVLAAGTTTTTSTSASAFVYTIKGKMYTATGAANAATPTLDAVTGAAFLPIAINKACVFVFCYDAAGAIKVVQGSIVNYSDQAVFEFAPSFPAIPDTLVPFGYEIVKILSTGSTWTMGVSNQAAQTGITKTFQDICTMPERPQII